MNPGSLREKIEISRAALTDDGMGGSSTEQAIIHEGFASVVAVRSKDGVVGGRDLEMRTHLVTLRLEGNEPQKGDVILWRGKRLTVKAIRPDYAAASVDLDCIEET